MHNPDMYPVTADLENRLIMVEHPIKQELIALVGEYEHGTADAENVFAEVVEDIDPKLALKMYARVVEDIVLSLQATS